VCDALFHEALFHEALFHEALFHEALFHDAEFQEAEFHDAEFQEALFQEALFQEAEFQEAEFHDALFHEAEACAALIQAAQSKPPVAVTKASSARFGLGASGRFPARAALTSPTPPARPSDRSMFCAVSISAPFT